MKKSLLLVAFATFLGNLAMKAQVYYSQDFEAGLPADWSTTGQWVLTTSTGIASSSFQPPAHTKFMGFNDDGLGQTVVASGRITTGAIDLTNVTGPIALYFASYFVNGDYQGADETAKVSVSTDAGATWTEILNNDGSNWGDAGLLLDYAGQTIWLAFDYNDGGGWNYGWCIDDIRIAVPTVLRDVSFRALNGESLVDKGLVGGKVYPGCAITNYGIMPVNSIDLTWNDGTNTVTETISGLNIAFGGSAIIKSPTPHIIVNGVNDISVSISNVNGLGADENTANDQGASFQVTSTTVHPDKGILVEEATGTWCQWCPRGAVFMDVLSNRYPGHFVGVAVHNQDPMVLAAYNTGVTSFPGFTGFPSVIFNRTNILDPGDLQAPSEQAMNEAPPAKLQIGATYDDATRKITVSLSAEFLEEVGAGYKLNAILMEDEVTGTAANYSQANAYSGGAVGPMGGYEILSGSVPANQMVYDHVGRALLGGFNGVANSLPTDASPGEVFGYTFNEYTIPAAFDVEKIHIVGVITDDQGHVVNAALSTIEDAVSNGLFVSGTKDVVNNDLISVSPNPFSSVTNVSLNLSTSNEVSMQIFDAVGRLVAERSYGELVGQQLLPFDGTSLNSGVYFIHVRVGETISTKRVLLNK